jgi:hypothetical protein
MVWVQAGILVGRSSKGFAAGALGGEGREKGKEAVLSYGAMVQVGHSPKSQLRSC